MTGAGSDDGAGFIIGVAATVVIAGIARVVGAAGAIGIAGETGMADTGVGIGAFGVITGAGTGAGADAIEGVGVEEITEEFTFDQPACESEEEDWGFAGMNGANFPSEGDGIFVVEDEDVGSGDPGKGEAEIDEAGAGAGVGAENEIADNGFGAGPAAFGIAADCGPISCIIFGAGVVIGKLNSLKRDVSTPYLLRSFFIGIKIFFSISSITGKIFILSRFNSEESSPMKYSDPISLISIRCISLEIIDDDISGKLYLLGIASMILTTASEPSQIFIGGGTAASFV